MAPTILDTFVATFCWYCTLFAKPFRRYSLEIFSPVYCGKIVMGSWQQPIILPAMWQLPISRHFLDALREIELPLNLLTSQYIHATSASIYKGLQLIFAHICFHSSTYEHPDTKRSQYFLIFFVEEKKEPKCQLPTGPILLRPVSIRPLSQWRSSGALLHITILPRYHVDYQVVKVVRYNQINA